MSEILRSERSSSGSASRIVHKDAYEDSVPLTLAGMDATVLEVRLLSALDLAVTRLGRFSSQDPQGAIEAAVRIVADLEKPAGREQPS
jgi:hypothetical protein